MSEAQPNPGPEIQLHHVTETYSLRFRQVDYAVLISRFKRGPELQITAEHGGSVQFVPELLDLLRDLIARPASWANTTFPDKNEESDDKGMTAWERANQAGRSPGFAPPRHGGGQ